MRKYYEVCYCLDEKGDIKDHILFNTKSREYTLADSDAFLNCIKKNEIIGLKYDSNVNTVIVHYEKDEKSSLKKAGIKICTGKTFSDFIEASTKVEDKYVSFWCTHYDIILGVCNNPAKSLLGGAYTMIELIGTHDAIVKEISSMSRDLQCVIDETPFGYSVMLSKLGSSIFKRNAKKVFSGNIYDTSALKSYYDVKGKIEMKDLVPIINFLDNITEETMSHAEAGLIDDVRRMNIF